jgi:hypothetical protein
MSSKIKKVTYQTRHGGSLFNRVIELYQKMFTQGLITCLSTVDSEAPAPSNNSVTSLWPSHTAWCRGVLP